MSETFPKPPGDQTPVGYKPLPGTGNKPALELRSLVYATVGVALGIMAGTVFADGSWKSFVPEMARPAVFASSEIAKPAPVSDPRTAIKPTPAAPIATPARPGHESPAAGAEHQTLVAEVNSTERDAASRPSIQTPHFKSETSREMAEMKRVDPLTPEPRAVQEAHASVSAAKPAHHGSDSPFGAYLDHLAKVHEQQAGHTERSVTPRLAATHRPTHSAPVQRGRYARNSRAHNSLGRRSSARTRRASWRRYRHHRLHAHPRAVAPRVPAPVLDDPAPVATPERFAYIVEGSVTVSNYDAKAGSIQTYEGETFIVDKTSSAGDMSSWIDYPADLHYTCDQTWACTLVHGGVQVVSAHRTH